MLNMFLTQRSIPIIGFCAKLLGYLMSAIYVFFDKFGVKSGLIALCIVVFTLIVRIVLLPLNVKQQKFTKVSAKMNPEIQEIQKKYRNKKDQESMMKMNEETQAVYQKYGTSPTGSCLQLLIQMPILFSLYYIIYCIPAYVPQVYNIYKPVAEDIQCDYDEFKLLDSIYDNNVLGKKDKDKYSFIDDMLDSYEINNKKISISDSDASEKKIIDVLNRFNADQWSDLKESYENADEITDAIIAAELTDDDWDKIIDDYSGNLSKKELKAIKEKITNGEYVIENADEKAADIDKKEDKILKINELGPINLSLTPNDKKGISYLIPILCFVVQFLSVQISMSANKEQMQENPMGNSMKVMNIMMPLMSAFIALSVPSGLGFYWVCSGLIQVVIQIGLNIYFNKIDVDDIIEKNVEKMKKKKIRQGIDPDKIQSVASSSTKGISGKVNISKNYNTENGNSNYKKGSMAEKANMVKKYNDQNRK